MFPGLFPQTTLTQSGTLSGFRMLSATAKQHLITTLIQLGTTHKALIVAFVQWKASSWDWNWSEMLFCILLEVGKSQVAIHCPNFGGTLFDLALGTHWKYKLFDSVYCTHQKYTCSSVFVTFMKQKKKKFLRTDQQCSVFEFGFANSVFQLQATIVLKATFNFVNFDIWVGHNLWDWQINHFSGKTSFGFHKKVKVAVVAGFATPARVRQCELVNFVSLLNFVSQSNFVNWSNFVSQFNLVSLLNLVNWLNFVSWLILWAGLILWVS